MVSFSCEACGDVLTKKKLDPHRNQCYGASFTCIDCMVHFQGTQYRSHTSCISEAQKYQGALYKEPKKNQTQNQRNGKPDSRQNTKSKPNGNHRQPQVEDAPDADNSPADAAPPPAPTPPPAPPSQSTAVTTADGQKPINVFDFLVTEETPNASRVSLGGSKEQMQMVDHARSVFEPGRALARLESGGDDEDKEYDIAYEENGFSYGAEPIKPALYQHEASNVSMNFMTPAPKLKKDRSKKEKRESAVKELARSAGTTSDKKRKRGQIEELNVHAANSRHEEDTPMTDAPSSVLNNAGTPQLAHSGLTGGLNRMMRSSSPEDGNENYSRGQTRYEDPTSSPIKRTRRQGKETKGDGDGLGISIKSRAERLVSSMFGGGSAVSGSSGSSNQEPPSKALVRTRRRGSSDGETRPSQIDIHRSRKTHKVRHPTDGRVLSASDGRKTKRKTSSHGDTDRPSRRLKQIEYRRDSDQSRSRSPRGGGGGDNDRRVVVYRQPNAAEAEFQREMANHFLSLVNKGPDSGRGWSVHKALKRFHRDFPAMSGSEDRDGERGRRHGRNRAERERRVEDEKELWRGLRLKRNDRGEVVLFVE